MSCKEQFHKQEPGVSISSPVKLCPAVPGENEAIKCNLFRAQGKSYHSELWEMEEVIVLGKKMAVKKWEVCTKEEKEKPIIYDT